MSGQSLALGSDRPRSCRAATRAIVATGGRVGIAVRLPTREPKAAEPVSIAFGDLRPRLRQDGRTWGVDVWAYSFEDAENRAVAMRETAVIHAGMRGKTIESDLEAARRDPLRGPVRC